MYMYGKVYCDHDLCTCMAKCIVIMTYYFMVITRLTIKYRKHYEPVAFTK